MKSSLQLNTIQFVFFFLFSIGLLSVTVQFDRLSNRYRNYSSSSLEIKPCWLVSQSVHRHNPDPKNDRTDCHHLVIYSYQHSRSPEDESKWRCWSSLTLCLHATMILEDLLVLYIPVFFMCSSHLLNKQEEHTHTHTHTFHHEHWPCDRSR